MALPPLPAELEDPWYDKRSTWDAAVGARLDGDLEPATLDAHIESLIAASGGNFPITRNYPVGVFWASPALMGPTSTPPISNVASFYGVWYPEMPDLWGWANVEVTQAGTPGDTVTIVFYGATPDYEIDTGTVLDTIVFPADSAGRKEVALTSPLVIPERGMFSVKTAHTNASVRLRTGTSAPMTPGVNNVGLASGGATMLTSGDRVNVFLRSTS